MAHKWRQCSPCETVLGGSVEGSQVLALASTGATAVLYLLLALSVFSVGIVVERWWFFRKVWLPHVAGHETQSLRAGLAEHGEEAAKALFGAFFANPEQPACTLVDLVDDGEVLVSRPDRDLIDADGLDAVKAAMGKAVVDYPADGAIDDAPVGAENGGDLAPRQPPRRLQNENIRGHRLKLIPWRSAKQHRVRHAAGAVFGGGGGAAGSRT